MINAIKIPALERSRGCAVIVSVFLTVVLGMACQHEERIYGISRTGRLPSYPDAKCVASALRKVRGIEKVEHRSSVQSENESARGLRDQRGSYTRGFRSTVKLGVFEEPTHARFGQAYRFVDRKPSTNDVRAARELMIDVELAVEKECHIAELRERVQEYCEGMDCD